MVSTYNRSSLLKLLLFAFLLNATVCRSAFGQHQQFKFRQLSIEDGLSDHEVTTFFRDARGFVWVGTSFGLNRFDGNKVKQFLHDSRDTTSLLNNWINKIFETPDNQLVVSTADGLTLYDPELEKFNHNLKPFYHKYSVSRELKDIVRDIDGGYWFVENKKVIKYSPRGKSITFQYRQGDTTSIVREAISNLCLDGKGNAWIVHVNGVAEKLSINNGLPQVSDRVYEVYKVNRGRESNYLLLSDVDGDLWFCGQNLFQGVFFFNVQSRTLQPITQNTRGLKLNTDRISSLTEVNDGMVWVGTDHGGINIIDKRQKTVRYILHHDEDVRSLAENSVMCIYRDNQGIAWVGTYKRGVSYFHESMYRFEVYKHYSLDRAGLPFADVNKFQEDAKGNLWIGTNGGGLLYFDRSVGTFKQYRHQPGNNNSISGDVIVSLWMDKNADLWIGTFNGGLNKFDGKNFKRYKNIPENSRSLPSQNIWELYEDSKGRFWIGTIDAGVVLMDKKSNEFHRLDLGAEAIRSPTINVIKEDRLGRIWFGTMNGIDVLSVDGKTFTHFEASAHPNSLSNNRVLDITEDSKGRIWIATMDGLNLFSDSLNGFAIIRQQLPHRSVMDVREDNKGRLWMSTLYGLCEMNMAGDDPRKASFRSFVESDGLQGTQFNTNAAFKTRAGELVFGGPTGFIIFSARKNEQTIVSPQVTFTDLKLFQEPVAIGECINGLMVLPKAIGKVDEVVLPPNSNLFSIRMSPLTYLNPERSQYLYKLEGLNTEWLKVEPGSHEISFNGLSSGRYKLRVKVADNEGNWSTAETVLPIIIQPNFWKTKTAFMLYAVLFVCSMLVARKLIQQREKFKFALEQERQEIQRVHELDLLKVKFFTNVSHEFRTPLTLILTPLEKLIKNTVVPEQLDQFKLIHRNANRLMKLVNQLLDFKKLEVQEIKFDPHEGDIVAFTRDIVLSFSDIAEKKAISLQFNSSLNHFETLFDADKLEKILFNLLSNAFKFTLEGSVVVNLDQQFVDDKPLIQIAVADTGIGIPPDKLDEIFEPFFQSDLPKSIVNQGSGIGLSITKEFVRIHGGTIDVTSEVGVGSTFIIKLPLKTITAQTITHDQAGEISSSVAKEQIEEPSCDKHAASKGMKCLLLVEDDDDVRFYLKDNLKFKYEIHESPNGADAWEKLLRIKPDLVVSDIMMPELNGIELCTKVKTDERVSHVPVILLTALSSDRQRLEGLKVGADDYISKPFNFEVLEARIENLLSRQQNSQKGTRKTLDVKARALEITPLDEKFIEKAIRCVEDNISTPYFSVESLAEELGISRAYMFKKIQALTGKTPLEFMRTIRLQQAAQLLERSQLSVREVAYKVGFNNPKYFARYFKEHFGVLPSNYSRSENGAENS